MIPQLWPNSRAGLWPRGPKSWCVGRTLYVSVPFTWDMPEIRRKYRSRSYLHDRVVIGGPGVYLTLHFYPGFLDGVPVEVRKSYPSVLQIVNPQATRTHTGCIRSCHFCGVKIIEPGGMQCLETWPNLPVLADNNLTAAPVSHFDRVLDGLARLGQADFEQGLDPRLLTEYHARRIAEIKKPLVRLALDSMAVKAKWEQAFDRLRSAGIAKKQIRSYALVGFDSDPAEAWTRCRWITEHGVKALPMWFHRLDALEHNVVTQEQVALGWNDYERRKIMQWFYQHRKAVK